MRSIFKLLFIASFTAIIISSCYPDETKSYADTDVVVTRYDNEFTFSDNLVCVLLDSVAHVVDEGDEPKVGEQDQYILDQLYANLQTTKFDIYRAKDSADLISQGISPEDVDLIITTTALETDFYNYYYYPWYDYWYWGWGWGWYWKSGTMKSADATEYYWYPWYPWGGGVYYAYTTGTLMIDMLDANGIQESLQNAKPNDEIKLPVVWTGLISGILSSSTSDIQKRIESRMEQTFDQSPYLK